MEQTKWGFLREKEQDVLEPQKNSTAMFTPLSEYLKVIFPEVSDWEHNKPFSRPGQKDYKPDYISEDLKLVIEFDGLWHYKNPELIEKDFKKAEFFRNKGYKFVNIPYFIQLTNEVVETMFGVHIEEPLFDPKVASFVEVNRGKNTPAFLCPLGVRRMAQEFKEYPQQYEVNLKFLKDMKNPLLSGIEFLEQEYNKL